MSDTPRTDAILEQYRLLTDAMLVMMDERKAAVKDAERYRWLLKQMRDRIENLRGLCKTAVGYLRDENAEKQARKIANSIGDMEPPLNKTLHIVSELAAAQAQRDKLVGALENLLADITEVADDGV